MYNATVSYMFTHKHRLVKKAGSQGSLNLTGHVSQNINKIYLWKSQNHRMVGVGRVLWRPSSPTPLPRQGHLKQAAQDQVQVGFEYLQTRRIHNPSGQPVPVLCLPQSKEVLPHVQMELPVLQSVPVAPCPVAGHLRVYSSL